MSSSMEKPPPQLPAGNASVLRGISENFSFHASPESFISSRITDYLAQHPDEASALVKSHTVVRAKILNRNVAIVSSPDHIRQILCADSSHSSDAQAASVQERQHGDSETGYSPRYVAGAAYSELMASFFPLPNLLLADGPAHDAMRKVWDGRMAGLNDNSNKHDDASAFMLAFARDETRKYFSAPRFTDGSDLDLYKVLKDLSWRLLLGFFLGLSQDAEEDAIDFNEFERLQEDLLRGQFSLFPVRVNLGFWHSPRKVGIDSRKRLQQILRDRLRDERKRRRCPIKFEGEEELPDVADHLLLFTSSLAVKGLASLLTATMLNVFLRPGKDGDVAREMLRSDDPDTRSKTIGAVLQYTELNSPPIVGVMRRSNRDNILKNAGDEPDVLIPKGWDVWMYLAGAGRCNHASDGDSTGTLSDSVAFGVGPKTCLGQMLSRKFATQVVNTFVQEGLFMSGNTPATGVQAWLGWASDKGPQDWAADVKQLPTQRPADPVFVRISRQPVTAQ